MREYPDLYRRSSTTYVKVFNKLKHASQACRQIPEDRKEELARISRMSREDIRQLLSTATKEHPYFKEREPFYETFSQRMDEVTGRKVWRERAVELRFKEHPSKEEMKQDIKKRLFRVCSG